MPLRKSLFTFLSRNFASSSSAAAARKLPVIRGTNNIHPIHKPRALKEAQKALTDYLHCTRGLPFIFAELIAANSLFALSDLIRKIRFSAFTFSESFESLIRYHPINEFEFFLESIGIARDEVPFFLPKNKFFFSEDLNILDASLALIQFGFPWNKLGVLYKEEGSIFSMSSNELVERFRVFKQYFGIDNLRVVGICLAFPYLLTVEGELGSCIEAIFEDLEMVFLNFEMASCSVEENVDAWYKLCRKVKVFYELGCVKGKVGELMCKRKELIFPCPKEALVRKAEYFCKFGVRKDDVGLLLLESPEVLNLDLETPVISVLGFLEHFRLDKKELQFVGEKYPHVLGRNKMANLPHVMKALSLREWCFNKIRKTNGRLLATYAISGPDEDVDKEFVDALERIKSSRWATHAMSKVDFLRGIGFGENGSTVKVLKYLHGTRSELQERFDCFLRLGIEHSKVCLMIKMEPHILSISPELLEQKVNFLCHEMGSSLQYLEGFPGFLSYDLETRIKRRYRLYVWLRETGLSTKRYSIASMLSATEKKFIIRLLKIHPAAAKQYLECF
ncbi:hypothetical protein L484_021825 [Morus notabilis]|uniref:mTERF domain-containing protein 1 n=1 Tax=Morus notabilis TaxID=981085 RepID=W9QSP7_9ROSA|nr:transcription termination factor MTEF18, mitochondrial [Morus notabilis]EXB37619.1 hypothetical protein L484_021825 [Morus notabilis]